VGEATQILKENTKNALQSPYTNASVSMVCERTLFQGVFPEYENVNIITITGI